MHITTGSTSRRAKPTDEQIDVFLGGFEPALREGAASGKVIQARRKNSFGNYIRVSLSGEPGDSGRPLLDDNGRLLGMLRSGHKGKSD